METVIITGGSGFIGSNLTIMLLEAGYHVINIDRNPSPLESKTQFNSLKSNYTFCNIDLTKNWSVNEFIKNTIETARDELIVALIHMAAYKDLTISYDIPQQYYENNLISTINTCKIANAVRAKTIIFSSSAAVYDDYAEGSVAEEYNHPGPSPYGYTKLVGERIIDDMSHQYCINSISLRYQNPMGSYKYGPMDLSTSMFGNVVKSIRNKTTFHIFGGNYKTDDGTPIRDYVDIRDICKVHLYLIKKYDNDTGIHKVFNVGSGEGSSCKKICDYIKNNHPELDFKYDIVDRRPGDAAGSYANINRIEANTGWVPTFTLKESIDNLLKNAIH